MIKKIQIKLLFLISIILILSSCNSIVLKKIYTDIEDPLDKTFLLQSNRNLSIPRVKEYYKNKTYISNINVVNDRIVFTYNNDMNPLRIGKTEDMFPNYFKDIKYKMNVNSHVKIMTIDLYCNSIIFYYKDSLVNINHFPTKDQEEIFSTIIDLSIADLEIK